MKKVRTIQGGKYAFFCLGCEHMHAIPVKPQIPSGWDFNGNVESPTFSPSILVKGTVPITDAEADHILAGLPFEPKPYICHLFIKDGQIQYLSDCTHKLAGKTVDMMDMKMGN